MESEKDVLIAQLQGAIGLLLRNVGDPGQCRGCGAAIWWVTHRNWKKAPYTAAGINHFIDCPKAADFGRVKSVGQNPQGVAQ